MTGRRRWTRTRWTLGGLLALGLLVVSGSGYAGLDRLPVLAQVTAFRVQWAGAALLVLVVLGWWLRAAALPLVLVALASVGLLVPRVVADGAPAGGTLLRVYSANVRFSSADVDDLAASIAAQGSDVVALPEGSLRFAQGVADRLRARGLDYAVGGSDQRSRESVNTSMLVRATLGAQFVDGPAGLTNSTVAADLTVDGRRVLVQAVHPASPVPGDEGEWAADLGRLQPSCRTSTPTVVLGDLNATLDHSGLREVVAAGCTDAAESTGDALVGTWPQTAPRWLGAQIDHVLLAGGVRAQRFAVLDDPGSDHRAVAAVLVLP